MRGCGLQCVTTTGLYKMLLLSVDSLDNVRACVGIIGPSISCIMYLVFFHQLYTDGIEHALALMVLHMQ